MFWIGALLPLLLSWVGGGTPDADDVAVVVEDSFRRFQTGRLRTIAIDDDEPWRINC